MNYLFVIVMFASVASFGKPLDKDSAMLKSATQKVYAALKNETPLIKNPLQGQSFEKLASRSYIYFYRARAYAHMAKGNALSLGLLEHALDDLKSAKSAPMSDVQRIDALAIMVLKDKIAVLHAQKKYTALLDAVEQLPAKDRSDARYVVYYANALFRSSATESFKRFARAYHTTLTNKAALDKFLDEAPNWGSVLASLAPAPIAQAAANPQKSPATVITKEMLLAEPKLLSQLDTKTSFKSSDDLFKNASNLYFVTLKKDAPTSPENKFLSAFRRRMHDFAPAYIDTLIFSFWKAADLKSAELLSLTFLDRFVGHPLYPKILFNLGRLQEDSKNYLPAAKTYKKFLATSDDAVYLELARFRVAWVLYLANRDKEALPYFEEYVRNHPEGRYASTSEYVLLKLNVGKADFDKSASTVAFIKKYPLNLYAFLLADEHNLSLSILRQTLSSENNLTDKRAIHEFKADVATLSRLKIYAELRDFGLHDDAVSVLKDISFDTNNASLNLYLASQFRELADTHGEVSNLIKVVNVPSAERDLVPWKGLFPDFQLDTIKNELAHQNVTLSPLLILSLIRQESAFDSAAQSTASAFGLMQLTEGTAKTAANQMQLNDYSLLNIADNLRLGIKTFSELIKKYGRVDYALCAYNAGETPTNLWIALRGHLDPIKFIESIPYPETRIYVKGILRNWAIYRMLYEDNPSPLVWFNVSQ